MKTIGVIGGIGPQATMDFEARVHAISQQLIPQFFNRGYPPMLVYYHRYPPFIVDDQGKPIPPYRPEPHLHDNISKLGALVDFIVITSNAPHLLIDLIQETTGRTVLSMIDLTIAEVQRRGWRHVGVPGFSDPKVYTSKLEPLGITTETLPGDPGGLRDSLDRAILALMCGQEGLAETALAQEAIATMRARNVDGIILGCTEIPLLLGSDANATDLLNPLQLLAEAAVKFAIE